ncbi:hypothetical protein CW751_14475 [Brumimicrobium salinarum]|uniref:Type I restriction modification DNA specificity domain-containing protein n=1 Tax=Brumimicrobium salinarum TaxID=2058658 RepID=A0A2I0QYZ7_9FLAO|nr:restriction endonuclease subunit S [Brumimicrobium salinarum]PKR79552.1 hypothetical protein CW751_14475 [Brumimicrobium salinarum]
MKEYKNYKKSSLEFIGKIPVEWKEGKIRYFFDISRGRVISKQELKSDGQFPVYSSQTKNDGCLGYIKTYDYEGEKLTWTTDGANAGEVFHRSGKFNCTNVCGILDAKEKDIYLKFFMYSLQFVTQFYKRPDTNGAKIMSNEMANIYTVLPSPSEQTKIAQYLDHKTGLIDNLIQKKEELIKKLEEQRQAIINEAVTKGLDPNAKMKNSGVEWLGEIPEGWKIVPMRFLTKK